MQAAVLCWIDNDAARDSLIRGFSPSLASFLIVSQFFAEELKAPNYLWFARVPSHSNIADAPSRGKVAEVVKKFKAMKVSVNFTREDLSKLTFTDQDTNLGNKKG